MGIEITPSHNNGDLHTIPANNNNDDDDNKFIVKYRQNFYDIAAFMRKHPGGVNTLKGLNRADMTARFMKAPPHSDAAMYLLNEYKIKSDYSKNGNKTTNAARKFLENGIELISDEDANNNTTHQPLDESMEHLVDWSKAMLPQICKITKCYDEWVHKPVDRPLRLFGPWYLEMCTKTPWWLIPIFWFPVIFLTIHSEFARWTQSNNQNLVLLSAYFIFGILFWTLLEYTLHRWVFHMKVGPNTNSWLCTLHFMIHGLHHKVPFDSKRLVFPPVPGVIITSILYAPLSLLFPHPRVLLAGALFGYVCYDLMHYYLHYGNPTLQHMYYMKRYHYQHHFAHQDSGYGITSPLWDFVFNSRIHLRKLRFRLRWN